MSDFNICINKHSPRECKEKYKAKYEECLTLKKYINKQEEKIVKLQTKVQKLIADHNKNNLKNDSEAYNISNFDLEDKIHHLEQLISQFQSKNDSLEAKLKVTKIQLASFQAKKYTSSFYNHITPRIDTGLRNPPRRSRSLTNLSKNVSNIIKKNRTLSSSEKNLLEDYSEGDSIINCSPQSAGRKEENLVLPSHIQCVLEEARKRIIILLEEQDQLKQQLEEFQHNREEIESELMYRIEYLEKELTSANDSLKERQLKEEKELTSFIRTERESSSLKSRVATLQERLDDMEFRLESEKKLKKQFMESVEQSKIESIEIENKLKEYHLLKAKQINSNKELKERNLYLQKQITQLEVENENLSKLSSSVETAKGKNQESEILTHLKAEMELLKNMLKIEKDEKVMLREDLMKEKEIRIEKESELKHQKMARLDISSRLNRITKNGIYDISDIEKLIESYKISSTKTKVNGFDKVAFNELEKKFNELQFLYREKKLEVIKLSTLLEGHADTYKQLQDEKESLERTQITCQKQLKMKLSDLENLVQHKEEECKRQSQQLLSLTSKTMKVGLNKNEAGQSEIIPLQTLSYGKRYNVLEFSLNKILFDISNFGPVKSFISWVMPFDLVDPLQHTNLAIGTEAKYKHSVLYKFKMNNTFLTAIQEGNVLLNIFILLSNGHPVKVGESQLSLKKALDQPPQIYCDTTNVNAAVEDAELEDVGSDLSSVLQNMGSKPTGSTIGTLHFWIRLLQPCNDVSNGFFKFPSPPNNKEEILPINASKSLRSSIQRQASVTDTSIISSPPSVVHELSSSKNKLRKDNLISKEFPVSHSKSVQSIRENEAKSGNSSKDLKSSENYFTRPSSKCTPNKEFSSAASLHSSYASKSEEKKRSEVPQSKSSSDIKSSLEDENAKCSVKPITNLKSVVNTEKEDKIGDEKNDLSETKLGKSKQKSSKLSDKLRKAFRTSKSKSENVISSDKKIGKGSKTLSTMKKILSKKKLPSKSEIDNKKLADDVETDESNSDTFFEESHDEDSATDSFNSDEDSTSKDYSRKDEKEDTLSRDVNEESDKDYNLISNSRDSSFTSQESCLQVNETSKNVKKSGASTPKKMELIHKLEVESDTSLSKSSTMNESKTSENYTEPSNFSSQIHIEVVGVKLFKNSRVMKDSTIKYLYVDYHGFLNLDPSSLETPQSLPKPSTEKTIYFNFKKTININMNKHPIVWRAFEKLIDGDEPLRFTLTSEPPPDMQENENCKELGCAYVNMKEFINIKSLKNTEHYIKDLETDESVGKLLLRISIKR